MQKHNRGFSIALILVFLAGAAFAQSSSKKAKQQAIAPLAGSSVTGSGTPGQISKWTGVSGSNTYTIGDTNITEDKFGNVGIGTKTPTSPLTVQGMIETTLGGYKFPDGTLQTTAGLASVFTDTTLTGNGTQASPLSVAVPLNLSGSVQGSVLVVSNTKETSNGITVNAGNGTFGGNAIVATGGRATTGVGG